MNETGNQVKEISDVSSKHPNYAVAVALKMGTGGSLWAWINIRDIDPYQWVDISTYGMSAKTVLLAPYYIVISPSKPDWKPATNMFKPSDYMGREKVSAGSHT